MSTTSKSRIIAAPPRLVILSGDHAPLGRDDCREGIWGRATSPFPQTNYRRMLTPSTPPSFHPARLSMTRWK
jgi:hypothetical protein